MPLNKTLQLYHTGRMLLVRHFWFETTMEYSFFLVKMRKIASWFNFMSDNKTNLTVEFFSAWDRTTE